VLLAEAQARYERRMLHETAYMQAIAAAAGYHGREARECWEALEKGMRDDEQAGQDEDEVERICRYTKAPPEVIRAALARGVKFPEIRERKSHGR